MLIAYRELWRTRHRAGQLSSPRENPTMSSGYLVRLPALSA
jgi:hypothetical protein